MPSRLASGANTCCDSRASARRARLLGRRRASAASAGATPGAAAPRAGRARTPAASCARARSAARGRSSSTAAPRVPRAAPAPACACARPGWRSDSPKALRTTSSGRCRKSAGVDQVGGGAHRRRRTDRLPGWRPRRRHAPARLRRCRAAGRRAAARQTRARAAARPPACTASPSTRRGRDSTSASCTIGAAPSGSAMQRVGLHGDDSRNSRTACTCSGCTSVGAWPTPANSTSLARGPALRHRLRGVVRQQVGLGAAQQQRRAAQRVVGLPQRGLAGRGQFGRDGLERHRDVRVVVRHRSRSPSAFSCGSRQRQPLLARVRAETGRDGPQRIGRFVERLPAPRLADIAADARKRRRVEARPDVVEHQLAHRRAVAARPRPGRSARPSTCRPSRTVLRIEPRQQRHHVGHVLRQLVAHRVGAASRSGRGPPRRGTPRGSGRPCVRASVSKSRPCRVRPCTHTSTRGFAASPHSQYAMRCRPAASRQCT